MTAHSAAAPAKATLITFPPSLDCELSRFVLGYYAVPYEEVRHTVLFSFLSTLLHGGTLHFPLLYGGGHPTLDTVAPDDRPFRCELPRRPQASARRERS